MSRFAVMGWALLVAVIFGMAGCGGGGGGSASDSRVTLADAGKAQNVVIGNPVRLDGSGSVSAAGSNIAYQWTMASKPAGSAATLNDTSAEYPSFTPDLSGPYLLNLVVSDGKTTSAPANVSVIASVAVISIASSAAGTFTLQGAGLENVVGMQLVIGYDSADLANPRVTLGSLASGMMIAVNPVNPIKVAMVSSKPIGGNGSGTIATVTFDRIGASPGKITSISGSLIDSMGKQLDAQFVVSQ